MKTDRFRLGRTIRWAVLWIILAGTFLLVPAQGQFVQQGSKLAGNGVVGQTGQGASLAVSGDGNTAIIGGPGDNGNIGAAWVFTRSGGMWTQQGAKLVGSGATGQAGCTYCAPGQGASVALAADGNTAIVGGPGDGNGAGAVWVFTHNAGGWTQQGSKLVGSGAFKGSVQGQSVALSADGNTAIVGGIGIDANGYPAVAAWVFTRIGGNWTQQGQRLVGKDGAGPYVAMVGGSVALSQDGNTAILGGINDNTFVGAAWVFARSNGAWTQQGSKLVGSGAVGNAQRYVEQGISVGLSGDGNTAIVGGYCDNGNVGAAWVFTRGGGTWTQQGPKLVGSGAVGQVFQGQSVALSGDGNTAIIGGPEANGGAGAAWLFTRVAASAWGQQGGMLIGNGANGQADYQGSSVALSGDGNTAILGGPGDNGGAGAAWVFTRSPGAGTIASVISAVVNGASFQPGSALVNGVNFQPSITSDTWITIQGTSLSPTTDTWSNAIVNGNLPTSLDGVSVQLQSGGGLPVLAYIAFVSPNQINFLCPNLPEPYVSSGEWGQPWTVTVNAPSGGSNAFTVWDYGVGGGFELLQPAFFLWPSGYPVATRQDFSYAVKNGTIPGTVTVPAKPGDILILWGTGFGPTSPLAPMGTVIPPGTIYNSANPVSVTIGGRTAVVYGAALTPGAAGLYQVAIQVPPSLPDGDYNLVATVYYSQSPPALFTVRQ